jgi:hypothetical protein
VAKNGLESRFSGSMEPWFFSFCGTPALLVYHFVYHNRG